MRPQGAPVGLTVAADGAIWLAEDKNQTIIRIDAEPELAAVGALPCGNRTPAEIARLVDAMMKSPEQRRRFGQVREQLIERHCVGCHTDFDLKPGMGNAQRDQAALRFILAQDELDFSRQSGGRAPVRAGVGHWRGKDHAGRRADIAERSGLSRVADHVG